MKTSKDNTSLQSSPAAWIGLDWGDQEHAFAIQDAAGKSETSTLSHSAENLHAWLKTLGERYGARPIALAIEASRGPVIHALLEYPWRRIYLINPITSARYRSALTPSGAKDDLPDAKVLLELVRDHAAKLRVLESQDPATVKLAGLVEARRKLVDRRTQLILQVQRLLKSYHPQALEVAGDLKSEVALAFLNRWPDLLSLKSARPATIKRFYYLHQIRSQELVKQRLALIAQAKPLTTDNARTEVAVFHLRALLDQLKAFRQHIPRLDDAINQAFGEHADQDLFNHLPGAGRQAGPALMRGLRHATLALSRSGQLTKICRSRSGTGKERQSGLDALALAGLHVLATNLR